MRNLLSALFSTLQKGLRGGILFLSLVPTISIFPQISATDGSTTDWNNLPQEYVYETTCAEGSSLDALKSVKVFADLSSINLLVEWDPAIITDLSYVPFHVYLNVDPGAETGGFGDQWLEPYDIDILMEGFFYIDGEACAYEPGVFAYAGAYNTNEWNWTDITTSMCCFSQHIGGNQMEIKILREMIPAAWTDAFTIAFDIQQSWNSVGVLPNAPVDETGYSVKAEKMYVNIANVADETITIFSVDGMRYMVDGENSVVAITVVDNTITSFSIPETVTYDGNTYTVTSIEKGAFKNCTSLTSITIPNSVTSIREEAFYDCRSLISIKTEAITPPTLGNDVFAYCSQLTAIYIPSNTLSAYQQAWGNGYTYINNENTLNIHVEVPGSLEDLISNIGMNPALVTKLTLTGSLNENDFTCMRETMTLLVDVDLSGITNTSEVNFQAKGKLVRIILPNNLESIGERAFGYCRSLASITIPNNVMSIGEWAFYDCSSLTNITIGNSVTNIGELAFLNCEALTSFIIPNNVTSVGERIFAGCISLASVVVDEGNTTYDSRDNCNAIIETASNTLIASCQNTIIPNSVTSIGNGAFYGCRSLTSITIPNSITSIGDKAFGSCHYLTSIAIPNSVTSIGSAAFNGCSSFDTIHIEATTPPTLGEKVFTNAPASICYIPCGTKAAYEASAWAEYVGEFVEEGCLDSTMIITYTSSDGNVVTPYDSTAFGANIVSNTYENGVGIITFDGSVTSIGDNAFFDCPTLTSITIPNSVTSIGYIAFERCSALYSITLPENLTFISTGVFMDCSSLNSIAIPDGIREIYPSTFQGCSSLTSIKLPNSLISIDADAFAGCLSLISIKIPQNVTYIGNNAFGECIFAKANFVNLSSLEEETDNYWGAKIVDQEISGLLIKTDTIVDCRLNVSSVIIPNGITRIHNNAFSNCSSLTSITIPEGVTSIGYSAFKDCINLININIPNSVTQIDYTSFDGSGIYKDESYWENDILYIDDCLIWCRANPKECIIKDSTRLIAEEAFIGKELLKSITLNEDLRNIGRFAFYGCSIDSIIIPKSVTYIGDRALGSCLSLESIIVEEGNSVYDSRENCNAVIETASNTLMLGCKTTYIPNDVAKIGDSAFRLCGTLTSITIPNSVMSIQNFAFNNCENLDTIVIAANTPPSLGKNIFGYSPISLCYIPCGTTSDYQASDWAKYVDEFVEEGCVDSTRIITYTSTDSNVVTPYNAEVFGANIVSNIYENGVGTITFDSPVTSIGEGAFNECSSLFSITIPNSVTSIGNYAFSWCSSLTSITIPNSVTSIGEEAFNECSSVTSMVVEVGNTTYDSRDNCSAIIETATNTLIAGCQNTTILNSVTSIGNYAFNGCSFLTSVTIPNSVTSIGNSAFSSCSSLTSVTIPNSVTNIGDFAFASCFSLTSIAIPNSVTSIGSLAFSSCSSLISMAVEDGNIAYDSRDNCNAIIETATNTLITGCQTTIIPNSVTSIGSHAFYFCDALTSITIPSSVTSIGEYAFYDCISLASITIPKSITSIGRYAFVNCINLTTMIVEEGNITYDSRDNSNAIIETATNTLIAGCGNTIIPNSVTSIGNWIFPWCSYLTTFTIPNSVTSIGEGAFWQSNLTSVTIGNSVASIGYGAFAFCDALDTIHIEAATPPTLGTEAFHSAPLSICYIPCGTKAAYEASGWAEYVGEFVEECDNKCGNQLYWGYDSNELSIIGYGNMYDYDLEPQPWQQYRNKMQTISLPEGITSIGASAFAECKYVKSVTIPSTVEKIYDSAFEDCRMLATLTFAEPSVLISIGNWAFYNNHELKSVVIPDGVTEIGYAAFYGCTYLDELTLPASMEYIADNSFALCAKLRRMNVSAAIPPAVEARTFEDVDRSIPVVVPDASVNQYKAAPVWQEFNIIGKNSVSTSVDNVDTSTCGVEKLLRDGQLIILRDGVEYNVMGQEL